MRRIKIPFIKKAVKKLLIDASFSLPGDILDAVKKAKDSEDRAMAGIILQMILDNAKIAKKEMLPLCQDCGNTYIEIEMGPDICISGGSGEISFLEPAINEAVAEVYRDYYLRTSIVADPLFERINTDNNTPAIIGCSYGRTPGLGISVYLKGGGSENCSWLFMLNPSESKQEIIARVLDVVRENATKACPPVIVGLGIGGSASGAVTLAKKAVFRPLDIHNPDQRYKLMEKELLQSVNNTGIGPQGLGGKTTALGCNIEFAPCHMATLPVAVFLGCHSTRRANVRL